MSANIKSPDQNSRLFTSHGTVLFVDKATGELRHGSFEHNPFNVIFEREGEDARLRTVDAGGQQEFACLVEYSTVVGLTNIQHDAAAGGAFSYVSANDREFGLRRNGLFLSAEPDGRIALCAPHLKAWEMFHTRTDAFELSGTVVSHRIDGLMINFFITKRNDWIQYNQCRGDFYEREGLDLIKLYCRPERTFVDIGANIGNHAVFVSKICGVSDVILFEPNPRAIQLLRINLALNGCRNIDTRYLGFALGSEAKQFRVHEPSPDNLGGAQMEEDASGTIRCIPGDEVLLSRPVGFIKIDVEGMEFDVLKGLRKTIERWRPNIYVEVKSDGCPMLEAWCRQFDYEIGNALQWDNFLLLPNN